jgi:DNA polymerase-3 subunit delta
MNPIDLEKSLKKGELDPIYLFLAEEPYWVHRLTESLRPALQKKTGKFEEIKFEGNEFSVEQLLSEISSLPFFATHRLIRVTDSGRIKKGDWGKIFEAQKQNASLVTLLLIAEKKEVFREASKAMGEGGVIVECSKTSAREIPSLVVSFAKEEGKKINASSSRLLIELIGSDLLTLKNQITLLSIFVGEQDTIGDEDIQNLVSDTSDKNVFALTGALTTGNRVQAFSLLRHLIDQGEPPIRLLGLLARHYRILGKTKLLLKKGKGPREMAQELRLAPFVIEKYLDEAQGLNWKKWIKIYEGLGNTDQALKSSPVPAEAILERFIGVCLK